MKHPRSGYRVSPSLPDSYLVRMVVDTDPGIDDAVALLFLAGQPDVELVAVGSVHGNVDAVTAAHNALQVLAVAGLQHVPVAIGAARPMAQPAVFSDFVHGADGLGGCAVSSPGRSPIDGSAAEQLVRLARQFPGELVVLALGPLTNIALALLLEERLPQLLRHVVVMGGAVETHGNISAEAEANIFHDPEAADLVVGAGFDLTLVGLDVTDQTQADAVWLDKLAACPSPRAQFTTKLLRHYAAVYGQLFGDDIVTLHDALAAAIAVSPDLAGYHEWAVEVEKHGTQTRGRTVADRRPFELPTDLKRRAPIKVATSVDRTVFLDRLLAALCVTG